MMEEKRRKHHEKDPISRRATFGVTYPTTNEIFEPKDKAENFASKTTILDGNNEKGFILSKRMTFNLDNATFRKKIFKESAFHDKHGETAARVSSISFEDCDFRSTFFGGTVYKRVVFRRCTFERCDFMNAEFEECIFNNCQFVDCTAYKVVFERTEVDPEKFYGAIKVPSYNFPSLTKSEQKRIKREWVNVQLSLARQLLGTSSDVYHTQYIDKALFILKKSEFKSLLDKLLHTVQSLKNINGIEPARNVIFLNKIMYAIQLVFRGANIILTKGGTSLGRLLSVGILMTLVIATHLSFITDLKYNSIELSMHANDTGLIENLLSNIPYSISLFLGFGYSGFIFDRGDVGFMVFYTLLGLAWYALLITIILRKIYK